jgi:replicative superfamily II helicase
MITKALIVTVLILLFLVSFFVDLPPGIWVSDWLNVTSLELILLTNNLLNGFFYGGVIGIVVFFSKREKRSKKRRLKSYSMKRTSDLNEDIEKLLRDTKDNRELSVSSDLIEIDGIGQKRAKDLMFAGVKSISDLSKRSPKHLSRKTGIPIKTISKWIINANEIMKNRQ